MQRAALGRVVNGMDAENVPATPAEGAAVVGMTAPKGNVADEQ